jgi:hypothetical protein
MFNKIKRLQEFFRLAHSLIHNKCAKERGGEMLGEPSGWYREDGSVTA